MSASLTFQERRSYAFGDSGLHLRRAPWKSEAGATQDVECGLRLELVWLHYPFGGPPAVELSHRVMTTANRLTRAAKVRD